MTESAVSGQVLLPDLPGAAPVDEAVLFAFDEWAFPFQNHAQIHLIPGLNPSYVLRPGPEGSHDENLIYYGTTIRIGGTFHMWYCGSWGPLTLHPNFPPAGCSLCYATSSDGVHWEKPDLGLVEFNGSKHNNIVDFPIEGFWAAQGIVYEPDEPDPNRRFKMAYEVIRSGTQRSRRTLLFHVAFSPDGLRWTTSAKNPVGPFLEMAGITKRNGFYYVNGQGDLTGHHPGVARRLATFVSADFETWSPFGANGLDRSQNLIGPSLEADQHQYEEVHLGAALWNRGNVLLGIYGQWHGHPTGDRRMVTMDLGLAISHDAIHFQEPIPGFRFIPSREQLESPWGVGPALMQGQGMENLGDQTLYWYSLWRGPSGSGVRMVSWERDRLGMLKPFDPREARVISCPIQVTTGEANVYVNASGLNEHSRLRVGLMDEGFRLIPGYSGTDAAVVSEDGLRSPVRWKADRSLRPSLGRVRLDVQFEGIRPEDCRLHAIYVGESFANR